MDVLAEPFIYYKLQIFINAQRPEKWLGAAKSSLHQNLPDIP